MMATTINNLTLQQKLKCAQFYVWKQQPDHKFFPTWSVNVHSLKFIYPNIIMLCVHALFNWQ